MKPGQKLKHYLTINSLSVHQFRFQLNPPAAYHTVYAWINGLRAPMEHQWAEQIEELTNGSPTKNDWDVYRATMAVRKTAAKLSTLVES